MPFGIKSHWRGCSLEGLISVKLTREAQAGGDTMETRWLRSPHIGVKGPEADIVERLVVNAESLV